MAWNFRRGKYNARKTVVDGLKFDSAKEANRWMELTLLQKAGEIEGLQRQVKFEIVPKGERVKRARHYVADFVYAKDGRMVIEDCKGFRTDLYKLKRDIVLTRFPDWDFVES